MELSKSDVVLSLTGRDQGMLFFVVDTDGVYVSLVNGKERKLENPKRKKAKHVRKVLRQIRPSQRSSSQATNCSTANYEETWLT